jgi:HSP20 family molecular chaperone IbpA
LKVKANGPSLGGLGPLIASAGADGPDQDAAATPRDNVLRRERGVCLPPGENAWQVGELCLTGERVLFRQPKGLIFATPLHLIRSVGVEKRLFTVVRKPTMVLSCEDPRHGGILKAWFITPYLGRWLVQLSALMHNEAAQPAPSRAKVAAASARARRTVRPCARPAPSPPVQDGFSQEDVERVAARLDSDSREILWHLWLSRHATIDELAAVSAAPSHMDVLLKIKQGINPLAREVLGRSILAFEESRFDRELGEMVTFSWWVAGEASPAAGRAPEIEVFDEGHEIHVVVALPGLDPDAIRVEADRDKVTVWAGGSELLHHIETPLPAPVDPERVSTDFKNGILIVSLPKA